VKCEAYAGKATFYSLFLSIFSVHHKNIFDFDSTCIGGDSRIRG